MPVFTFEAIKKDGQKVKSEVTAESKDEAIRKIQDKGLHPTKLSTNSEKIKPEKKSSFGSKKSGFKGKKPGKKPGGKPGGKFGGNFIPETLKKPIDDLTKIFTKLRKDKKFLKMRDHYFKSYVGAPTPFIKLENLTDHLGGAQIYAKVVSEANGGAHKIYNATVHCLIAKKAGKKFVVGDTVLDMLEKCFQWRQESLVLNVRFLWAQKILKDNNQM